MRFKVRKPKSQKGIELRIIGMHLLDVCVPWSSCAVGWRNDCGPFSLSRGPESSPGMVYTPHSQQCPFPVQEPMITGCSNVWATIFGPQILILWEILWEMHVFPDR